VTSLVASGHLGVEQGETDRRVRWVRRTPKGDSTVTRVTARMLEIEEDWAGQVGERRYRTFRRVLEELTLEQ
jgi:DNA-binding MarR family transcriptional regulator